ncbi:hypothetical protein R1flu_022711 [Riccia fluitans]|uniref:Uncharacterized protein n=1 Tax=Riccia fluitans TaxID=41844 RepID=A0ABD1XPZ0_9MARC
MLYKVVAKCALFLLSNRAEWESRRVLLRSENFRYLGIIIGFKVKPSVSSSFILQKVIKRVLFFSAKELKFKAKVIIIRFLLQSMFSLSLPFLRLSERQLRALLRILRVYPWGYADTGKPKVLLVAWDWISSPLGSGRSWNLEFEVASGCSDFRNGTLGFGFGNGSLGTSVLAFGQGDTGSGKGSALLLMEMAGILTVTALKRLEEVLGAKLQMQLAQVEAETAVVDFFSLPLE